MKAVVTDQPNSIEIIDLDVPEPGAGEVRVKVSWAAINPVDAQTASGIYHQLGWIESEGPVGLGADLAGTVDAVGEGVTEYTVGQEVIGLNGGVDKKVGALSEYVVLSTEALAARPESLAARDAVTLPLAALTAWQSIDLLGKPEGVLLVTGAAGSVGGFALPLAAEYGWSVIGLARETDRAFVESTGARFVSSLDGLEHVDGVFDAAVLGDSALALVRDGGHYVGVMPPAVPEPQRGIEPVAVGAGPNAKQLAKIVGFAEKGRLAIRHAGTFPLDDVQAAFAASSAKGLRGKVTVKIAE
jgi:NADPH:quinone reductase-like Zn-dependent oxidoreductase